MKYTELTPDERILLVGMVRKVASADNTFSDQEKDQMVRLAAEMGEDAFKEASLAGQKLSSAKAREAAALAVTRPEARELIFTTLQDLAVSDEVAPEEMELINWLADLWDL